MTFLGGASCEKSKASTDTGAIQAADDAKRPLDRTPVPGVDVSKYPDKGQKLFFKLVDSLSSPCGKAHSLRTSVKDDPECKRAPFAVKYLAAMIEDEISEDDVRKLWAAKYKATPEKHTFEYANVPRSGSPDAPIKIVEFFDYGCPACMAFKPIMDEVASANSATTVVYYKMFPLTDKHPNSMSAAQAALAAAKQGKFKEMHDALFEHAPEQTRDNVMEYAADIEGLDIGQFERDYDAAEPAVHADMSEGNAAGVDGTPTIFFNGVQYEGPAHPKYFKYWIDEDLAVNR